MHFYDVQRYLQLGSNLQQPVSETFVNVNNFSLLITLVQSVSDGFCDRFRPVVNTYTV